jgi:hypothetical protein
LTWRRLGSLLERLPRDSQTVRELYGSKTEWSVADHLLAHVVDAVRIGNWQRSGDKKAKRPKPFPRPGDKLTGPARLARSASEMHARLLEQRQRLAS